MPVPILLITGFLGAGKTTLVNRLLSEPRGRRLAAVVNDFGVIDIDAALLSGTSEGVVSLKNGCICCSLQGDLLQTLSMILRRIPAPDGIVIETSGVSNPTEIIRALLDPVIWKEAALDAVICVTDARTLMDQAHLFDDALWRSQLGAADYIALSKTDLVSQEDCDLVRKKLRSYKADRAIYAMVDGHIPPEILFSADLHRPTTISKVKAIMAMPAFQTLSWTSKSPMVLARFQGVVGRFASKLVRAKGIVMFDENPGEPMLFQLVGTRVTIGQAPASYRATQAVELVFIARSGSLNDEELRSALAGCCMERAV